MKLGLTRWVLVGVGALVLFGGMGVAFFTMFGSLAERVGNLQRGVFPGRLEVKLERGKYLIFHEPRAVSAGSVQVSSQVVNIRCTVTAPDGAPVDVVTPRGKTTYNLGGHEGHSLFGFETSTAGIHTLECADPTGREAEVVLAVGPGLFGASLLSSILIGIGALVVGFGIILLAIFFRRVKPSPAR